MSTTAPSTRLHRSKTTGEWVPCRASVRPCPREHISISASGDLLAEKSDMLADVVATVKKRNRGKSVEEQLAAVRAVRADLRSKERPYEDASKALWKIEDALITQRWTEAAPRDYAELDDYDGAQTLMDDAFSDSAASNYQKRYFKSLDRHLEVDGYRSTWMLPAVRVRAPYGLDSEEVQHLADAIGKWGSFVLAHRDDASNTDGSHKSYRDAWSEFHAEEEAQGAPFEIFEILTDSDDYDSTPALRVYADGTATAQIKRYGSYSMVDMKDGKEQSGVADAASYYAHRRPIAEVLGVLNKVWYYPATSNPAYEKPTYSWPSDYLSDDDY